MTKARVTDHAILRYLERAYGLDVELVRQHLAGLVVRAVELEATGVRVENVMLVLRGDTVTTVLPRDGHSRTERSR